MNIKLCYVTVIQAEKVTRNVWLFIQANKLLFFTTESFCIGKNGCNAKVAKSTRKVAGLIHLFYTCIIEQAQQKQLGQSCKDQYVLCPLISVPQGMGKLLFYMIGHTYIENH